ncbi:hypothetical protein [Flammeovirga sp. SubArs3]|uniref:hypothetical protein n=1 Tax=Flammeovirga sp. SubArs3 TaxID=2995316 RepID=UPI00248CBEDB|nr:hypothetical protein [Flammeovirga sp. SubArs3]
MKRLIINIVLGLCFGFIFTSCGGRNINSVVPKSTSFEFSHGSEPRLIKGQVKDTLITTIYVPGKIVSLDVEMPYKNDYLQINLAEKTKSHFEEQVHSSLLRNRTYMNVKGNDEAVVYLNPDVLNEWEEGRHSLTFAVLDEKNTFKQIDLYVNIISK